jgi:aminopeptidase N
MWEDGYATSKPVILDVTERNSMPRVSDPIVNSKGAAILRMLESIVTVDTFKNNMRVYKYNLTQLILMLF